MSMIGLFIVNFGVIDYLVFDFLEAHLSPEQFAKIKDEPFKKRIIRIKRYVLQSNCSVATRERFDKFFARLDPMRDLRNHIAHSHLLTRLDDDGKNPVLTLSLPKNLDAAYSPDSRHLGAHELQRELDGLTELIAEFKLLSELFTATKETS